MQSLLLVSFDDQFIRKGLISEIPLMLFFESRL